MLGNLPFQFKTVEKISAAFGWIFSDISIQRTDPNTLVIQTIKVPVMQLEKEKWDERRRADPNAGDEPNQRHVNLILPRITYELTSFAYDPTRKLSSINYRVASSGVGGSAKKQLNPVPIKFFFSLYVKSKTVEDGWAMVEQIVPFFQPDYVVPILDIPEMNIQKDIIFTMISNTKTDEYAGAPADRRNLMWHFEFEAKGHMYPPIRVKQVITEADVSLGAGNATVVVEVDPPSANIDETFDVLTDYDGEDRFAI